MTHVSCANSDVEEIERQLDKNVCYWFIDNKLNIHCAEDRNEIFSFCK